MDAHISQEHAMGWIGQSNRARGVLRRLAFIMIWTWLSMNEAFPAPSAARGAGSLDAEAAAFKPTLLEQIEMSLLAAKAMRDCIHARDLAGAQKSWLSARDGWERSEIAAAELFPDLDRAIDAWPDAQNGFHAIEARLFGAHNVDAGRAADELVGNLLEFQRRLGETTLRAQTLLNGTAKLLYEVGEDKSGGGESPFSGNSLPEIVSNVAAITQTYERVFAHQLRSKNERLHVDVKAKLERLRHITSVPSLALLDTTELRDLTETLSGNFISAGASLGLEPVALGN
jgi:iron uptake system EfeUOB component EfeO/EfeM